MSEMVVQEEQKELLTVSEEDIRILKHQYDLFRKLQKDVLEEDVDYGYPAGKRSQIQKPSLYKSGAEKLTRLFNLVPEFEIIQSIERDDFIMYKFRCRLKTQKGIVIGDGFGACNSKEKAGWDKNPWQFQNNILKMAKKRAHVDAVLTGVGASNVFTQDIEDMDEIPDNNPPKTRQSNGNSQINQAKRILHEYIKKIAAESESSYEEVLNEIKEKFGNLNVLPTLNSAIHYAENVLKNLQEQNEELDIVDVHNEIEQLMQDIPPSE